MRTPTLLSLCSGLVFAASLLSADAHAGERSVRVAVEGPGADGSPQTAPLPWTASWTAAGSKSSVRFTLSATAEGDTVVVVGDIVEIKGKKEKPARHFSLELAEAGIPLAERSEWLAPKGYTAPDGAAPAMLQWRLSASWDEDVPAPAWDTAAPASWPAGEFVVVRTGAGLYRDPAATAPQATAGFASEAAGEVWEVTGEVDGRLALRAPAVAGQAHPMPQPAVAGTGVVLYVDKSDVLDVVPEAVDALAEDGTGLRLRAGVPIETDGEAREAGVGPLRVTVGALETADRYRPSSHPPARTGTARSIRARQGKAFGETHEGPVEVKIVGTPDKAAPGRASEVLVAAVQVGGRFAVTGPAGEALVRVRPGLERVDHVETGMVTGKAGPTLPVGTALSWMDGAPAGTTTDAVHRSASTRALEDGRTCGRLGGEGGMTLCWE